MSTITATATDITERVRNEGEKQLQRLEGLAHPKRARAAAKRRSFGKFSLLVMIVGLAYAVYRATRGTTANDAMPPVHQTDNTARPDEPAPVQRLATASL